MKDKDGIGFEVNITDNSEQILDEFDRRLPQALIAAGRVVKAAADDDLKLDEELAQNCLAAIEKIFKGED